MAGRGGEGHDVAPYARERVRPRREAATRADRRRIGIGKEKISLQAASDDNDNDGAVSQADTDRERSDDQRIA